MTKSSRLGAALWIATLQFFVAEAIAIAAWRGPYRLQDNYISDLGELVCRPGFCSPLHPLMNASFLLQGFLVAGGAWAMRGALPADIVSRLGLFLAGAAGLGVFVVGAAAADVASGWHYAGAAENLVSCNFGMILLAPGLLRENPPAGRITLIAAALGFVGLIGLGLNSHFGLGVGAVERLAAYPFPLCLAFLGARQFASYRTATAK